MALRARDIGVLALERHRGRPVAVLASGDPFHYGVGDLLMRAVMPEETLCVPQAGAFSLAGARLGWSLQDVALTYSPSQAPITSSNPSQNSMPGCPTPFPGTYQLCVNAGPPSPITAGCVVIVPLPA